jgi:hypothetical protein
MTSQTLLDLPDARASRVLDPRQAERPHIFVSKLPERRRKNVQLSTRYDPARDVSVQEVGSAYAAFEFAAAFDVLLDMNVTLDFGRLGKHGPEEVQAALSTFTRCYAAWCNERWITPAWVASIEMGSDGSYHAHIALHMPGNLGDAPMTFRRAFRAWVRGYTERRGGWVPRAIKVRGGRKESLLGHWINFHYLMKGFDRTAVLCSARNSPDGRPVLLGDIIARHYRDPGPVALNRRVSTSNSLGPKRREFGAPPLRESMLPHGPNWEVFEIDRSSQLTLHEKLFTRWQVPIPTPFRSTLEDGIYDVRNLYPPCFYRHVTRMPVELALKEGPCEPEQEDVFDGLTEYLRLIDV